MPEKSGAGRPPRARGNVVPLRAPDPATTAGTRLNVLGGFSLLVDGELVEVSTTGQRLMGLLACRGRQATRSQVAYVLWPDSTNQRALANLRTSLHRISRRDPPVLRAVRPLAAPVTLAAIKADDRFAGWELVRQARLSVMPVPDMIWAAVEALGS